MLNFVQSRILLFGVLIALLSPAHAGDVYINPKFPISGGDTGGRSTLSPPVIGVVNDSTHNLVSFQFMFARELLFCWGAETRKLEA